VTSADESRRSHHELPIDPDVDVAEDARHHRGTQPELAPRPPWPHFQASVIATVFAGGCLGGLVRYAVTKHWPTPNDHFPWPTFTVNIAGAFVLAVIVVIVSDFLRDSTYTRPLIGTGFCGALTTFSSVVVEADQRIAHGHAGLATTYLATSIVVGLLAAWLGVVLARAFVDIRGPAQESAA
jgi:fluoride exporter